MDCHTAIFMNLSNNTAISVVIPVHKEQEGINPFLSRLAEIFSLDRHQIIVVDGGPKHETLVALNVPGIVTIASDKGRGKQMNIGASKAGGDILLFVHADTFLPDNAPELILTAMKDKNLVGGAFSLGIETERTSLKLIARAANLRSNLTRVPYGDQAIFLRKHFFEKMGGFREIPIMEDLELMTRIRKSGGKISILSEKTMTSPRRWIKEGIIKCTLRNWLIRILYHLGFSLERISRMYG